MKPPSASLLRFFSPRWSASSLPWTTRGCMLRQPAQPTAHFSASAQLLARKKGKKARPSVKITLLRYHLSHPRLPRPLRFSRNRMLRHWTIHRAWQLYQTKMRIARERQLEKQYNSMAAACEALRLIDSNGMTAEERIRVGASDAESKDTGRLYRIAMLKKGIWKPVPIEYARIQTDTPSKDGWNHAWTR